MAKIELPKEGIGVQEFFTKYVPENLGKAIAETSPQGMDGTEVSIQFNITGEGGAKYCVKVIDAKRIEVVEGGSTQPHDGDRELGGGLAGIRLPQQRIGGSAPGADAGSLPVSGHQEKF